MSAVKDNNGEVDESICSLVAEAIDHVQATPELRAETSAYEVAVAEIEREHSGLIPRVQALRKEVESGRYPHMVTRNVWQAAEQDCIDAGHIDEREETS